MRFVPPAEDIPALPDARERLLAAGARLLLDDPFAVLAGGVSPERVTALAARSRRVFYDHFETKEDFVREVMNGVLAGALPDLTGGEATAAAIALVSELRGDFVTGTKLIAELTLGETFRSETSILPVLAVAIGLGDDAVSKAVVDHYEALDAGMAVLVEALSDTWGLELRPPWDITTAAVVIRALSDGLYMRSRFKPEVDTSMFALAMLSLVPMMTRPVGDTDDESVQEHLTRFGEELSMAWREQTEPSEIPNARQRTLEAVVTAISDLGPRGLTLEAVSSRAGVSRATIIGVFGGLDGLLRAAVLESIPSLEREALFDLRSDSISIHDAISRHLSRVGEWITGNRALTQGLLASSLPSEQAERTGMALECLELLSDPLVLILQAGISRRELQAGLSLREVGYMACEILLGRGAALEGFPLEGSVAFLADLVYRAMSTPPTAGDPPI